MLSEKETLEMLEKEDKFTIKIKKDPNNANYKTERVFVNGVPFMIEVGKEVIVPKTIKDMLEVKGII